MQSENEIINLLEAIFDHVYVRRIVKYYKEASVSYQRQDWESFSLKSGKFVEAVTKLLLSYCNIPLPAQRNFKAGILLEEQKKLDKKNYSDTVRIAIPKACLFIYEIVNNRGGRHDSNDIQANLMDGHVILPIMSWTLAELLRFATSNISSPESAYQYIKGLQNKKQTFFEVIDGRPYVNIDGLKAQDIALLLLQSIYPERISRGELIESVSRHGFKKNAASVAVHRIMKYVDDNGLSLLLRNIGIEKAESVLDGR